MPNCDFNKVALQFIEITLRHASSPVKLQHIFRSSYLKSTSGGLLLAILDAKWNAKFHFSF